MREKLEALQKFKIFKDRVENEVDRKIKCLRSNGGGEFTSDEFNILYEKNGIRKQFSTPRILEQNGVMERMNQTIQEATKTMIKGEELLEVCWREEIHTIVYTLNIILYQKRHGKTLYDLWHGRTPIMKYFKVFGSICYI